MPVRRYRPFDILRFSEKVFDHAAQAHQGNEFLLGEHRFQALIIRHRIFEDSTRFGADRPDSLRSDLRRFLQGLTTIAFSEGTVEIGRRAPVHCKNPQSRYGADKHPSAFRVPGIDGEKHPCRPGRDHLLAEKAMSRPVRGRPA